MELKMTCNETKMWSHKMPTGLDLEISNHPLSMRSTVNIIIALKRLQSKHSQYVLGTEFTDENLLNIVLESIMEEQLVFEDDSAPGHGFTIKEEQQCSVTDSKKRSLVQNSMELQAMMLQGGSASRKVYLNMSTYLHPLPSDKGRPVALCIKDTNLYLSCQKEKNVPKLHLEVVEDKSSLSSISSESDMVRFIFYKKDIGVNMSTLVSASFPEWYISTADADNEPVDMCQESAQRYRTFTIQRQS